MLQIETVVLTYILVSKMPTFPVRQYKLPSYIIPFKYIFLSNYFEKICQGNIN